MSPVHPMCVYHKVMDKVELLLLLFLFIVAIVITSLWIASEA